MAIVNQFPGGGGGVVFPADEIIAVKEAYYTPSGPTFYNETYWMQFASCSVSQTVTSNQPIAKINLKVNRNDNNLNSVYAATVVLIALDDLTASVSGPVNGSAQLTKGHMYNVRSDYGLTVSRQFSFTITDLTDDVVILSGHPSTTYGTGRVINVTIGISS